MSARKDTLRNYRQRCVSKSKVPLCDSSREELLSQILGDITTVDSCNDPTSVSLIQDGNGPTIAIKGLVSGPNLNIQEQPSGCFGFNYPESRCGNPVAYVDSTYGNDASGAVDISSLPFLTINAAITAMVTELNLPAYPDGTRGLIYMCPGFYFGAVEIPIVNPTNTKFIDYYARPGVVFLNGAFRSWAVTADNSLLDWKLYGKAVFESGSTFFLDVRRPSKIHFEFHDVNSAILMRPNNIGGLQFPVSTVDVIGNNLTSTGIPGGYWLSIQGQTNLTVELNRVTAFYGCRSDAPISGFNLDTPAVKTTIRCPQYDIQNGGFAGNNGQFKANITLNGANNETVYYGDMYSNINTVVTGLDVTGCIQYTNNNAFSNATMTVYGNLHSDIFSRCIVAWSAGNNAPRRGQITVNGNLLGNPLSDRQVIKAGYLTGGFVPDVFNIYVNDGYIQGGAGNTVGNNTNGARGMIRLHWGVRLELKNCTLRAFKNSGDVVEDSVIVCDRAATATPTSVYAYNCNSVTTNLLAGFINVLAGFQLTEFGAIDTNSNVGNILTGTITSDDPWGGFTIAGATFDVPTAGNI